MSANGHAINLTSHQDSRPRLLSLPSMNQPSRPPLETKHLNANHELSNARAPFFPSQKLPRFSLGGISSNPSRLSTPVQLRVPLPHQPSQARQEEERANGSSSPSILSSTSPERAYMQPNRALSPPSTSRRISLLQFSQNGSMKDDTIQGTPGSYRPSVSDSKLNTTVTNFKNALSDYQLLFLENEQLKMLRDYSQQEIAECKARLGAVIKELETVNSEVKILQPALAACKENVIAKESELISVKASLSELKPELGLLKGEYANVVEERNNLRREKEACSKMLDVAKEKTTTIINDYVSLGQAFKELRKAHDLSQNQLFDLSKEIQETRKVAQNGLAAVQPLLDDDNTLARAADTKAILKELQEDLSASHQVNDLLRDKLHLSGSQLMDAQGRIRELEDEKRGTLKELLSTREDEKRQFELLIVVEGQVAELSRRLSARERETIDVLANSAALDADLKAANAEVETLKTKQEVQVGELQALRVIKEEHTSKLLALQDVINVRDKEIISLKAEVKAMNESKAELRALLAESKKELSQKSSELQERNQNDRLMEKVSVLESKKEELMSNLKEVEQRHTASQDLEATLRAKIQALEKSNAELSSANAVLNKAQEGLNRAFVASGRCRALEDEVAELKGRLNVQSVSLFQSKEEAVVFKERVASLTSQLRSTQSASEEAAALRERVTSLSTQLRAAEAALIKREADYETLSEAQEKRASGAEASAAFFKSRLLASDQALKDMNAKVSELTSELSEMKDASVVFETENEAMTRAQGESEVTLRSLERLVAELTLRGLSNLNEL